MLAPDEPVRKTCRRYNEPGHGHELTFSCHKRLPLLGKDRTRQWFIDALDAARHRFEFELWAYVIMPEHAHVLIKPRRDDYDISGILKAVKQSVSRRAMNSLRAENPAWLQQLEIRWPGGRIEHRFWLQGGGYDRNILSPEAAWASVHYLHQNPVRRGLVAGELDWKWSSARWYAGMTDVAMAMDATPPDPPIR